MIVIPLQHFPVVRSAHTNWCIIVDRKEDHNSNQLPIGYSVIQSILPQKYGFALFVNGGGNPNFGEQGVMVEPLVHSSLVSQRGS